MKRVGLFGSKNSKSRRFFTEALAMRDVLDKEQVHPVGGVNTDVGANSVVTDGISQSRSLSFRLNQH